MIGLNRRRVMGGKSLPYDAEIEYLESTGTQWIDTGIKPNTSIVLEVKYMLLAEGISANIVGARWTGASTYDTFGVIIGTNKNTNILYGRFSNGKRLEVKIPLFSKTSIIADVDKVVVNGTTYNISRSSFNSAYSIYLFGLNVMGDAILSAVHQKIYSFKLTENENTLLDLIPVRAGNVGYMYDKVSGQLFGNSGTGDFILGVDK